VTTTALSLTLAGTDAAVEIVDVPVQSPVTLKLSVAPMVCRTW